MASKTEQGIIISQLLAAQELTGCDTNGCYFQVGKVKTIYVLKAGNKLDNTGQPESEQVIVIRRATKFIATCCGEQFGPDDNIPDIRYKP